MKIKYYFAFFHKINALSLVITGFLSQHKHYIQNIDYLSSPYLLIYHLIYLIQIAYPIYIFIYLHTLHVNRYLHKLLRNQISISEKDTLLVYTINCRIYQSRFSSYISKTNVYVMFFLSSFHIKSSHNKAHFLYLILFLNPC